MRNVGVADLFNYGLLEIPVRKGLASSAVMLIEITVTWGPAIYGTAFQMHLCLNDFLDEL